MRVVFVDNLLIYQNKYIDVVPLDPHLGLMSLVAAARAAGHHAVIFDAKRELAGGTLDYDAELYARIASRIEAHQPDVVGFTALGCNFICAVKVAGYLKRHNPDLPILLGGPHATILHQEIISNFPQFDVIARHEAETNLAALLDGVADRRFDGIPGLTFKRGETIVASPEPKLIDDLDTLPFPAYDAYPLGELGLTKIQIEAGRGCPFECTFCSTAPFFKRRYRLKSPGRLVGEMDWLHERYGFTTFGLTHDLFTVNRKKVLAFCEEVEGRGYTWNCSARMDCVDDELLERMSRAGCQGIYYGVETGSPRMQMVVQKKLDLTLVAPTLRSTIGNGMKPTVSTIIGYPQETAEDQNATIDLVSDALFAGSADVEVLLQMHLLTPEPGTLLTDEFREQLIYDGHVSDFNFETLEDDDGAIMQAHRDIFLNHFYFPSPLDRGHNIFVSSAFHYLIMLGHDPLRYILLHFDRSLRKLLSEMNAWRCANAVAPNCDETLVVAFLRARLGADHHVVSLARYVYAGLEIVKPSQGQVFSVRATSRRRQGAGDAGDEVLSARSVVVREIHDCARMTDRLAAAVVEDRPLAEGSVGPRGDYLLVARSCSVGQIENFRLSASAVLLLRLLADEKSLRRAAARFETAVGRPVSAALLDKLREIGALVLREPILHRPPTPVVADAAPRLVDAEMV